MAYDPGAIDAALAAAVGDDPLLIADLHLAFTHSAADALDAMVDASDNEAWRAAAWRLKGLAASFGAMPLMTLARTAADTPPGDDDMLRRLRDAVEQL